eukprot:1839434-Rhodomonas_salina.2
MAEWAKEASNTEGLEREGNVCHRRQCREKKQWSGRRGRHCNEKEGVGKGMQRYPLFSLVRMENMEASRVTPRDLLS